MDVFVELSLILALATVVAIIMRLLKQPLIVGYILTGIIAGPYFLNLINSKEAIEIFSKIGITILLFIVGLSLNPRVVKEVGKASVITGVGQVLFTAIIGFAIAIILGIDRIAALYIAIGLTFSSTIIILKLLSDKGDINKLYGKVSIGFLLVQDIIATIILILVGTISEASASNIAIILITTVLEGLGLILLLMLVSGWLFPKILPFISKSTELLFLCSIAWGLGLATLFAKLHFSIEIGALIAGVTLAATPFAAEIGSRLKPLRDFFIVLFFILLGSQMVVENIASLLIPALILSAIVMIGNPFIVIVLLNLLGYNKRTGFLAGLTVAQISEFSLILATLGFRIGQVDLQTLSLLTLVALITISASTYLILYADKIYPTLSKLLNFLQLNKKTRKSDSWGEFSYDTILFGYNRVGSDFVESFKTLKRKFIVIDYNPDSIERLKLEKIPHLFGDVEDVEFLEELSLSKITLAVSTLPEFKVNLLLVKKIRSVNTKAIVLVISQNVEEAIQLYGLGASYVIMPHYLGALYAVGMMERFELDKDEFNKAKEKHFQKLLKRPI